MAPVDWKQPLMSHCAAALSQHPVPGMAIGEVIGDLLGRIGPHPEVVVLTVSGRMAGSVSEIVAATHALLAPQILVGAIVPAVFGSSDARPLSDAVAMLAVNTGDAPPPQPFRAAPGESKAERQPGVALIFGQATAGPIVNRRNDVVVEVGQRLILDRQEYSEGSVGVVFPPGTASVIDQTLPLWDDVVGEAGEPLMPDLFTVGSGAGMFLCAQEAAAQVIGRRFDVEIALEDFHGSLAGVIAPNVWPLAAGRAGTTDGPDRRIAGLILH